MRVWPISESPIARIAWCPGGAGPICGHGLPSGPVGVGPATVVGGSAVVVVVGGAVVEVVVLDGPAAVRFVSVPPWHPAKATMPTTARTTTDLCIMSSMVAASARSEQSRKSLPRFETADGPRAHPPGHPNAASRDQSTGQGVLN